MKLDILNKSGQSSGRSANLPDDIFGIEPNEHAVYLAVKQYNAAQRQGTHKSKERGEITASTRKIKKQKGTGTARAGSLKSGVFRGGGRMFGPKPRDYSFKLNKKVKALAKASALSYKAANGSIKVVENFTFDAPKTKDYVAFMSDLEVSNRKSILVTADYDSALLRSSGNIPNAHVVNAKDLNTYEILNANTLLLTEGAIAVIKETFA